MSDTKTITAHSNAAIVRGILLKKCASATPRVKPTSTGMLNRISNPELLGRRCNSIGAINSDNPIRSTNNLRISYRGAKFEIMVIDHGGTFHNRPVFDLRMFGKRNFGTSGLPI